MKLGPREKVIAAALGVVLIVVLLVVLLVVPQFKKIAEVREQILVAQGDSQAATAQLQQRRAIKDQAATTDNSMVLLANAVPEAPELPSLIIELQDAAYESDVRLREITPSDASVPEGATGWIQVPVSLRVYGTWDDTVDYLERVGRLTRELRINSFSTSPLPTPQAAETGLDPQLTYYVQTDITVTSYVIPAPAPVQ